MTVRPNWKTFAALAAALTLVAFAAACQGGKTKTPEPAAAKASPPAGPGPDTTAAADPDKFRGWLEYGSEPDGFSVFTPKSLTPQKEKTETAAGTMDMMIYMAELPTSAWGVCCNDFPADLLEGKDPVVILKGAAEGFGNQISGSVSAESQLALDGHPGLQITLSGVARGVNMFAKARFYLVRNRMYQIYVISEKGKEDVEAIDRFLTSFKLK
jgi:hypothetical protein